MDAPDALAQYSQQLREYTLLQWNRARSDAEQKARANPQPSSKRKPDTSGSGSDASERSTGGTAQVTGLNVGTERQPGIPVHSQSDTFDEQADSSRSSMPHV